MGDNRGTYRAWWGDLNERGQLKDLGVEWKIILKWIFIRVIRSQKKEDGKGDTYGGQQRCRQGLVGRPEGKRPLGRPRRRLEDNIKMGL